jgi:hypothetical protein
MEIFFLPKEAVLLEFKRINGSGWLTTAFHSLEGELAI